VSSAPPSDRELDALREEADRFIGELDAEYYAHYAGLKEDFELAPIYERHATLAELETARSVGAAVDGDRRRRELWRFTCDGYLGNLTREHAERTAQLEASLTASVDGEETGFRMLGPRIANEPDRDTRRRLSDVRHELREEHLNPIQLDSWRATHAGARELGAESYLALHRDGFAMELDRLADGCRALLDETERLWEETADPLFRARAGIGLAEAERWDVPRVLRATEWDPQFPSGRMVPALEGTLADLGIDLRSQSNVHLDVEQRPLKSPRAFCAPIEVPGKVMLVIQPIGGPDDWRALFHEAGHTEHFAHASADLPVEDRRLGDNAVTEGWAALFERLVDDPGWLSRRLDFGRPHDFAYESTVTELYFVRRYSAKLLYELEFHATDDVTTMSGRYVELLGDALKIEPSPVDYISDLDPGFYASAYLRSWAFEAQLRDFLREEFGTTWFARREAGSLLRELWALGQQPTAEELLADVTGATLDMAAVGDRARETLRA
jgi:hypothetical protein